MTWQGMKGKRERKGGKVLFREQESPQGIAEKTCIHEYSLFSQLPFIPATVTVSLPIISTQLRDYLYPAPGRELRRCCEGNAGPSNRMVG